MVKRYHKKVYFPNEHQSELMRLSDYFNQNRRFKYTNHAYYNLKGRFDYMHILEYIANKIIFQVSDIFEYYTNDNVISKVCYKIDYTAKQDLIIVLTNDKRIVTVYTNNKGDNHSTLKQDLYSTV